MKILMVNKFLYPKGGAETYMFNLGEHLTSLGHQVEYFGMSHKDNCVGNSLDCYTDEMDFHSSNLTDKVKMSLKTIKSKEAMNKIGRVLDAFKPDIVHLNNINFQLTPSIIYEIKRRNIPIVQTVHDVQISCPNHRMYIEHKQEICQKCIDGNYTNCIKQKCLHNSAINSTLACIESFYYHRKGTYNLVDKYICPSKFIKDIIVKGGVNDSKTVVMHNFSQQKDTTAPNSDEKYALYFGRLSVEKGISTLIEACKKLPNIQFVFAGVGSLYNEIEAMNLPNVKLVGFKSGNELDNLIRNAWFTLCPSEWYENCPMTIIESLALGTPVVATDLGGCPELIENGKTGIIYPAGNITELKNAIEILYNKDSLDDMRSACILASKQNSIDGYTKRLVDLYSKLVEDK